MTWRAIYPAGDIRGFALVLPSLHATLRPVIESDGRGKHSAWSVSLK
jgi:hypothetical protein